MDRLPIALAALQQNARPDALEAMALHRRVWPIHRGTNARCRHSPGVWGAIRPHLSSRRCVGIASNVSPGTGTATVVFDTVAHTLGISVAFSGLLGITTAAHIHCCTAAPGNVGVATQTPSFTGFPLDVSAGTFSHVFDMSLASSFNAPFITANGGTPGSAEQALFEGMRTEMAYFNIHTNAFPRGEIRGFLQAVPEPGSLALFGFGLAGLGLLRRRRAGQTEPAV